MPATPVHVQVLIPNTYCYPYSKYTPGSKITPVPLYTPRKSRLLFYTPGGLYTGFYGMYRFLYNDFYFNDRCLLVNSLELALRYNYSNEKFVVSSSLFKCFVICVAFTVSVIFSSFLVTFRCTATGQITDK